MNRDEKATAVAEIGEELESATAVFAVDYRGISVPQAAELRTKLREADASFSIVKNRLAKRATGDAGAADLDEHLVGPTALTFVRGDAVAGRQGDRRLHQAERRPRLQGRDHGRRRARPRRLHQDRPPARRRRPPRPARRPRRQPADRRRADAEPADRRAGEPARPGRRAGPGRRRGRPDAAEPEAGAGRRRTSRRSTPSPGEAAADGAAGRAEDADAPEQTSEDEASSEDSTTDDEED